jgi:signal peptidase II
MRKKRKTTTGSISRKKSDLAGIAAFFLILLLDQASKFLVRRNMLPSDSIDLGLVFITYLRNTGVSFGLFKGFNDIFTVILILAFFFFAYIWVKKDVFRLQASIVMAGIAGNLIDRLFLGYVVDFINFRIWPVFNLADSAISLGILWLVVESTRKKEDLF